LESKIKIDQNQYDWLSRRAVKTGSSIHGPGQKARLQKRAWNLLPEPGPTWASGYTGRPVLKITFFFIKSIKKMLLIIFL